MLYLTGCIPKKPELQRLLLNNSIGAMLTPFSQRNAPSTEWAWAADNGCFAERWDERVWLNWLRVKQHPESALFATVPDVVADHAATLERWGRYHATVTDAGYKPAFVLQDGVILNEIPWAEMGALFIGGSTEFKLSGTAREATQIAKSERKWVHMGRVNSKKRVKIAREWGCDSVDGTYLAFGPDHNTPRLIRMMQHDPPVTPTLWDIDLEPSTGPAENFPPTA